MDKDLLNEFSKSATDLWMNKKYKEAKKYYEKVYPHLDSNHFYTTDFLSQYGLTLDALGKYEDATTIFKESIESAIKTDSEESVTVTLARFYLGEHLFKLKQYEESYNAISPSLVIECDSKWLLLYLVARIYHKQKKTNQYDQIIVKIMEIAPKGKFESIAKLNESIELSNQNF